MKSSAFFGTSTCFVKKETNRGVWSEEPKWELIDEEIGGVLGILGFAAF